MPYPRKRLGSRIRRGKVIDSSQNFLSRKQAMKEHKLLFKEKSKFVADSNGIIERDRKILKENLSESTVFGIDGKTVLADRLGEIWDEDIHDESIDHVEIQLFSTTGMTKRVYLAEAIGHFSKMQTDTELIPARTNLIPRVATAELRARLRKIFDELSDAVGGKRRPMLIKVTRESPQNLDPDEDWEPISERQVRIAHKVGVTLHTKGLHPSLGRYIRVSVPGDIRAWVTFQGLVPGLTGQELFVVLMKRLTGGQITEEEFLSRWGRVQRTIVRAVLEMWMTSKGRFIDDPKPSNFIAVGRHREGYHIVGFDIDRITRRRTPLFKVLATLRKYYGDDIVPNVVPDALVDAVGLEHAIRHMRHILETDLYQPRRPVHRLKEMIEDYLDHGWRVYQPVPDPPRQFARALFEHIGNSP